MTQDTTDNSNLLVKENFKNRLEYYESKSQLKKQQQPKESYYIIITIPAYNEENNIARVIDEINCVMIRNEYQYQIIVVDDGSIDNTKDIAEKSGALVFSNKQNLGLARTFQEEMKISLSFEPDIIVHTDADGQYPAIYIPSLIEGIIEGNDLVLGTRFGGGIYCGSIWKYFGNQIFAKILSILLRKKINDSTTGFRAFTKKVARIHIESKFTYTQEQLIRVSNKKYNIKEVPILTRKTRESRLFNNIFEYFYRAVITILKIFI